MLKLAVFPHDPLYKYVEKGEVKERYWNPENIFDEIHVLSLCKKDVPPEKVQIMAGDAKIVIHAIGRPNPLSLPFYFRKTLKLMRQIKPDVIRAYNPSVMGALAVYSGKKLKIPSIISIHADYNPWHKLKFDFKNMFGIQLLRELFSYFFLEPYSYKNTSVLYAVYEFAAREARKYRDDVKIIYNRVYGEQFIGEKSTKDDALFRIITVGQQIEAKNPENIIRAMKGLDDAHLTVIGNGILAKKLKCIAIEEKLDECIEFVPSVPHSKIQEYYARSDIFALSLRCGGFAIPELEAMATGLPIVMAKPLFEEKIELISAMAITVDDTPEGFRRAFEILRGDSKIRMRMNKEGRAKFLVIKGDIMEKKEEELYWKLLKSNCE